jgi:hypothetical protein
MAGNPGFPGIALGRVDEPSRRRFYVGRRCCGTRISTTCLPTRSRGRNHERCRRRADDEAPGVEEWIAVESEAETVADGLDDTPSEE